MCAALVTLLLAAASGLFVLSIPLWSTGPGRFLRRLAVFSFVAALLPGVLVGFFGSGLGHLSVPSSASGVGILTTIGAVTVLSVLAYLILAIRKRLRSGSRDAWSEYVAQKSAGKQPIIRRDPPTDDNLF